MEEEIVIPCSPVQKTELKKYLDQLEFASSIPGLYWLPVPKEMLSKVQSEHLESCGPYALALDTEGEGIVLETLVRAQNQLHCECIAFASAGLLQHMVDYLCLIINQKIKV